MTDCPPPVPTYAVEAALGAQPAKTHEVKTLPEFFDPHHKPFEVRVKDRNYQVGDILVQRRWTPEEGYTGRMRVWNITFILDDPLYCLPNHVVLGLRER